MKYVLKCYIYSVVYAESCDEEGLLRLVGWIEADAGRVEICHNGEWGTVCADALDKPWGHKNVEVACKALGYGGGLNAILHNTYVLYVHHANMSRSTVL